MWFRTDQLIHAAWRGFRGTVEFQSGSETGFRLAAAWQL
jgi:hypothetical protein